MARKTALNQAGFDGLMKRRQHGVDEASSTPWANSSFLGEGRDRLGRAEGGTAVACRQSVGHRDDEQLSGLTEPMGERDSAPAPAVGA